VTDRIGLRAPVSPRLGLGISPEQERQFQTFMAFDPSVRQWRNSFQNRYGEQPQIDGGDYDYRAAWAAGQGPRPYSADTVPHWGSAGKMPGHPTEWMQTFFEKFNGADPATLPAELWTPEMQEFMRSQIGGLP
jgi:hypothetical protein